MDYYCEIKTNIQKRLEFKIEYPEQNETSKLTSRIVSSFKANIQDRLQLQSEHPGQTRPSKQNIQDRLELQSETSSIDYSFELKHPRTSEAGKDLKFDGNCQNRFPWSCKMVLCFPLRIQKVELLINFHGAARCICVFH